MKKESFWRLLRRTWRAATLPRSVQTPARARMVSNEAVLMSAALQALDSEDWQSIMQSVCHELRVFSGADCTSVVLIDPGRGKNACRIAAGDGWPDSVVGLRVDLPRASDGSLQPPDERGRPAIAAGIGSVPYAQYGLTQGLWVPIQNDGQTVGWITAHARATIAMSKRSRQAATAHARIVASALRRERSMQEVRQQAVRARALCQQLPALWMSIDSRSGIVLDCNTAMGSWLGRRENDCRGKPAAVIFETADVAGIREMLCRPAATGAEVGVLFRLRHDNGSAIDCVADGILLGDAGATLSGAPAVLWVFHELHALQWAVQRPPIRSDTLPHRDFDWTLEYDRERREQSLRLLSSLQHALQSLRSLFSDASGDVRESGDATLRSSDYVRTLLEQAWLASEKAAIALASPNERITDLLAALQRLAHDKSESIPGECVFDCAGPVANLSAKAKLVAFRATRELLAQMINESNAGRVVLQMDTTADRLLQVRLVRQPEKESVPPKPSAPTNPTLVGSLGLFGIKTMLAGVGGTLTIAPGQHETTFAEFRIPLAEASPSETTLQTRLAG